MTKPLANKQPKAPTGNSLLIVNLLKSRRKISYDNVVDAIQPPFKGRLPLKANGELDRDIMAAVRKRRMLLRNCLNWLKKNGTVSIGEDRIVKLLKKD